MSRPHNPKILSPPLLGTPPFGSPTAADPALLDSSSGAVRLGSVEEDVSPQCSAVRANDQTVRSVTSQTALTDFGLSG